jgi:hypothetical protein
MQKIDYSPQTQNLKTLLLLEIHCCWVAMSNGRYRRGRRRMIVLTFPFSPLPATTQTPMNPPRKAAQAAALPRRRGREPAPAAGRLRLHRCWLRVRRRAAAPEAAPTRTAAAAAPAPPPPARPRKPLPARPLDYAWNATINCDLQILHLNG